VPAAPSIVTTNRGMEVIIISRPQDTSAFFL
jgi:hypothetical protein